MSANVLEYAVAASGVLLALAMVFAAIRLFVGPRAQDRVLGLDTLYVSGMLLVVNFGIRHHSATYFEVAVIIALLGFVGTVTASRFLLRGEVIE